MKSYLIGRSQDCDVVIADPSVGRQHADLITDSDTHFVLIDRNSTNGTFLWEHAAWRRVSSVRVGLDDRVRLGLHETSVASLAIALRNLASATTVPRESREHQENTGPPILERNPETGEIIDRRKG
jgi:predicted component of type VI protein secretion system